MVLQRPPLSFEPRGLWVSSGARKVKPGSRAHTSICTPRSHFPVARARLGLPHPWSPPLGPPLLAFSVTATPSSWVHLRNLRVYRNLGVTGFQGGPACKYLQVEAEIVLRPKGTQPAMNLW